MNRANVIRRSGDDSISARNEGGQLRGTVSQNRRRTEAQTKFGRRPGAAGDGRSAGGCRGGGRHRPRTSSAVPKQAQPAVQEAVGRQSRIGWSGGGGGGRFGEGRASVGDGRRQQQVRRERILGLRPGGTRQCGGTASAEPPPANGCRRAAASSAPCDGRAGRACRSSAASASLPTMRASDSGPSRSSSSPRIERVGRAPVGAPDWARPLAARSPRSSTRARTRQSTAALQPLESGRRNAAATSNSAQRDSSGPRKVCASRSPTSDAVEWR